MIENLAFFIQCCFCWYFLYSILSLPKVRDFIIIRCFEVIDSISEWSIQKRKCLYSIHGGFVAPLAHEPQTPIRILRAEGPCDPKFKPEFKFISKRREVEIDEPKEELPEFTPEEIAEVVQTPMLRRKSYRIPIPKVKYHPTPPRVTRSRAKSAFDSQSVPHVIEGCPNCFRLQRACRDHVIQFLMRNDTFFE